jgi:hypothetical protein
VAVLSLLASLGSCALGCLDVMFGGMEVVGGGSNYHAPPPPSPLPYFAVGVGLAFAAVACFRARSAARARKRAEPQLPPAHTVERRD